MEYDYKKVLLKAGNYITSPCRYCGDIKFNCKASCATFMEYEIIERIIDNLK